MLALIAGTGGLPSALIWQLDVPYCICALEGNSPSLDVDITFRIEQLGVFLDVLKTRGVTSICMAGAIKRPTLDLTCVDTKTQPFLQRITDAMVLGDDGALRAIIAIFEDEGFSVVAAHDIAPDLLPPQGILTSVHPSDWHYGDALAGQDAVLAMGADDTGQACIVRMGTVAAYEDGAGTDAMLACFHEEYREPSAETVRAVISNALAALIQRVIAFVKGHTPTPVTADDGILFKAPKPTQDLRADIPVIGLQTVMNAAEAGLVGIVIEAGGVIVLNQLAVIDTLNAQGMFLWVRPRSDP